MRDRTILDEAIFCSEERGTYYWCFLGKRGKARRKEYCVEVRVDLPPESISGVMPPLGWRLTRVRVGDGMMFMQRHQALQDKDLRQMFAEVLTFAFENNGKFHSWRHDPKPAGQEEI